MANKLGLSIALTADPAAFKKGFEDAVKITQTAGKSLEKQAKQMADAVNERFQSLGGKGSLRGAENQLKTLAYRMQEMGLSGTKAFNDVLRQAGKFRADTDDLNGLINAMRPDAPFRALGTALKAGTSAMAGLQGAMALVGDDSKEMQETMVKLQAAMALAMSTEAIDQFQDAFKELNAVISANPLVAVAAGFAAVAVAIYSVYDALDAQGAIEENYQKIQKKTYDNAAQEISQLDTLTDIVKDETQSREKRQAALDALNRLYPDTFRNYSLEKTSLNDIEKAHDAVTQSILRKAKVAAAEEMLTDIYKKQFEQQQKIADGNLSMLGMMMQAAGGGAAGLQFEVQKLGTYNKQAEALAKIVKELKSVESIEKIGGGGGGVTKTVNVKEKFTREGRLDFFGIKPMGVTQEIKAVNAAVIELDKSFQKGAFSTERQAAALNELQKVSIDLGEVLKSSSISAIESMSAAMGAAIVNSESMGKAIGQAFLQSMAAFMKQLGSMFIAAGVAKLGFDKAMISIGGAPLAIAAGAALVAASAAATAKIQQANQPQKFASGGIVGGNSFVGDRVPALVNSGEMILNKTQQMQLWKAANGTGSNGQPVFHIYNTFDERGIATLVRRGEKSLGRG